MVSVIGDLTVVSSPYRVTGASCLLTLEVLVFGDPLPRVTFPFQTSGCSSSSDSHFSLLTSYFSSPTYFTLCLFLSCCHHPFRIVGSPYLIFGASAGFIGSALTLIIRSESLVVVVAHWLSS